MSTSMLYHTNQIEDVQVLNEEYHSDKVIFEVLFIPKQSFCPICSHPNNILKGSKKRKLRMAPLGNKMSFLLIKLYRLQCTNCQHTWWPPMPFVKAKKRVTLSFEKYVVDLNKICNNRACCQVS